MGVIDIGSAATDRYQPGDYGYTRLHTYNPANATGFLNSIELWFEATGAGVKVGTFYGSSASWNDRDYETIGAVTAGSKQTFTGLNCSVTSADIIGIYWSGGTISMDAESATGKHGYIAEDTFGQAAHTYTMLDGYVMSVYSTGISPPAAPTNVAATDGAYTTKVVVTWTKSSGATGYRVYRDAVDVSGLLGDVATYNDTGANAPTITKGTAAASDGISTSYVTLSISGESANNGTTHTYKVVAVNDAGTSPDSATDTGYIGVGSLTYQWYRSAADSMADYSILSGATTDPYNDTTAPADGSGRYYYCALAATGATGISTDADRGYRSLDCAVSAVVATVTAQGEVPTVTTQIYVTVTAVLATATAQGYAPTITVEIYVTVSAVVAAADAAANVPEVTAEINVTVSAALAAADAEAGVPEVTAGQSTDSSPPLVEATAEAPVPEILAGDCVIAATLATADSQAEAPSISVEVSLDIPAEVIEATAEVPAPAVLAEIYCTVTAGLAAAAAEILTPLIVTTVEVAGELAEAAAEILDPNIVTSSDLLPGAAEATAEIPAPSVSAAVNIDAPLGETIAELLDPTISIEESNEVPAAEAAAEACAPTVSIAEDNEIPTAAADARGEVPDISTSTTITAEAATAGASSPAAAVQLGYAIAAVTAAAAAEISAPTITLWAAIIITPAPATATARAYKLVLPVIITHVIQDGDYLQESQPVNRVFVIGVDSDGAIVTGSAAQEVL